MRMTIHIRYLEQTKSHYSGLFQSAGDEYLTKARETDDPSERAEYYAQFQNELAKTPAYTFFLLY